MDKEKIFIDNITIEVKRKKVKNINLRIGKDKIVTISANKKISLEKLKNFVEIKKDWIKENLNKIERYYEGREKLENIEYITGEKIKINGEQYILMVIESYKNKVEIEENVVYLYVADVLDYANKKKTMDKFIKRKALEAFEQSLNRILYLVRDYGIKRPEMKIRKMKSRWGSCNRQKNKITINLELIKFSKDCLDYVVLHELIHFLVAGHNKEFYNYLFLLMPDWKKRKKELKEQYMN